MTSYRQGNKNHPIEISQWHPKTCQCHVLGNFPLYFVSEGHVVLFGGVLFWFAQGHKHYIAAYYV